MVEFSVDEVYIFTRSKKDLDSSLLRDLQLLLGGESISSIKEVVLVCERYPVLCFIPSSKLIWIKDHKCNKKFYRSCKTKSELIEIFIKLNYG